MKNRIRIREKAFVALLSAVSILFSACTDAHSAPESQESNTTQAIISVPENTLSAEELEAAEDLLLLDGTHPSDAEVINVEMADRFNQSTKNMYKVNVCFCVPFGTAAEKRTAFESGDWNRLSAGTEINGFTVEKAEASYFTLADSSAPSLFEPVELEQRVTLKGDLTCTGEAYKELALDDSETGGIIIKPDDDTLKKLFSLKPALKTSDGYQEFKDTDNYFTNEEKVHFYISNETKGFEQIMDKLSDSESVKVKLEADGFEIHYTFETGNSHDGSNVGVVNGGAVSLTV